jgi:hypothetical protein
VHGLWRNRSTIGTNEITASPATRNVTAHPLGILAWSESLSAKLLKEVE